MAIMERRWIPNLIFPGAEAPVSIQPPLRGEEMSTEPNGYLVLMVLLPKHQAPRTKYPVPTTNH